MKRRSIAFMLVMCMAMQSVIPMRAENIDAEESAVIEEPDLSAEPEVVSEKDDSPGTELIPEAEPDILPMEDGDSETVASETEDEEMSAADIGDESGGFEIESISVEPMVPGVTVELPSVETQNVPKVTEDAGSDEEWETSIEPFQTDIAALYEEAETLSPGNSYTVGSGESRYFSFQPEQDGEYLIAAEEGTEVVPFITLCQWVPEEMTEEEAEEQEQTDLSDETEKPGIEQDADQEQGELRELRHTEKNEGYIRERLSAGETYFFLVENTGKENAIDAAEEKLDANAAEESEKEPTEERHDLTIRFLKTQAIQAVSLACPPDRTEFVLGQDEITPEGMKVRIEYEDGSMQEVAVEKRDNYCNEVTAVLYASTEDGSLDQGQKKQFSDVTEAGNYWIVAEVNDCAQIYRAEVGIIVTESDVFLQDGGEALSTDMEAQEEVDYVFSIENELSDSFTVNALNYTNQYGISVASLGGYSDCFGNQLDGLAKEFYDAMVSAYSIRKETGDCEYTLNSPFTFKAEISDGAIVENGELTEIETEIEIAGQLSLDAFLYDHPEVFWMRGGGTAYSVNASGHDDNYTGTISAITFKPKEIYSGASTRIAEYDSAVQNAVNSIKSEVGDAADRYDLLKAIHDYVCDKAYYKTSTDMNVHSAEPLFIGDGGLVCEGYAKTFKVLCDKVNIPCACVGGVANTSEGRNKSHMWNYVQMEDNGWYLIDTTWDDQDSRIYDTYFLAGRNSEGFNSLIADERTENTDFSETGYKNFIYPVLSQSAYSRGAIRGKIVSTVPENGFYGVLRSGIQFIIKFDKKLNEDDPVGNGFVTFFDKSTGEELLKVYREGGSSAIYYNWNDNSIRVRIDPQDALPYNKDIYVTLSEDVARFENGTCSAAYVDPGFWHFHTVPVDTPRNKNIREKIAFEKYLTFFPLLQAGAIEKIEDIIKDDDGSKGICFGMCYSAIAWKKNLNTIRKIVKTSSLFSADVREKTQMGSDEISLLDYMQYAQIYQHVPKVQREMNTMKSLSVSATYDKILDYLNNNGEMIIIGVEKPDGSRHALLPVYADEKEDKCTILLYDCNEPERYCYFIMTKSFLGLWNDWEIRHIDYGNDINNKLSYNKIWVVPVDDTCDTAITTGVYQERENLLTTKIGSFKLNGNETYQSDNADGDTLIPIVNFNGNGSDQIYNMYWTKEDNLTIDSGSEIFEETTFCEGNREYMISADTPAKVSIGLDDNGDSVTAQLQANGAVEIKNDVVVGDQIQSVTFEGQAGGETVTLTETDNGYSIEGVKSFVVTKEQDGMSSDVTVDDLNQNEHYQVTVDGDELTVGRDNDGDGVIDDIIASSVGTIDEAEITIADQYYTGSALTPAPIVRLNGKTLVMGGDYRVTYSNNIHIGNASVLVEGIGEYTGSKVANFKIIEKAHQWSSWEMIKQATVLVQGEEQRSCTICGQTETRAIPRLQSPAVREVAHQWSAWGTIKQATVLEEGIEQRTCSICAQTETRTVPKPEPAISLTASSIKLKVKQSTTKLKVSDLAPGDAVESWKSSNSKIVKVNSKGKITAQKKTGKATITVTLASGLTKKIKVTVQKGEVACTKITLNSKSLTMKQGEKFTLKATVNPITCIQKVKFSSSNKKVATVSSSGIIGAKKKGKATITVTAGKKKVSCKVTVK